MPDQESKPTSEASVNNGQNQMHTSEVKLGDADIYLTLQAPPGTRLRAHLETQDIKGNLLDKETVTLPAFNAVSDIPESATFHLRSLINLPNILLMLSLILYLVVRLIGLADYPIYFFTDEAVQTVLAQDFIRDGLRGYDHVLFPTFFYNSFQYNLGTSVYLQVIPLLLFGKSIFVTRAAAVLATLIAAVGVGMILKNNFKSQHAWFAVLLLSITPAWFLHSRTAFETSLGVSFYTGFLYFYLRYRQGKTNNLIHAAVFGALTFYSYSPLRVVILVTGLLFFISDLRYHWQQRQTILIGLGLVFILAIPFIRFEIQHGGEDMNHLILLNSIIIRPIPFFEKLILYTKEYLQGLDPRYWYLHNSMDLARHQMGIRPHLALFSLPFMLIGIVVSLIKFRKPENRLLILALLAAPCGAALVEIGITRALVTIIPATLLAAVGFDLTINWLCKTWRNAQRWLIPVLFITISAWNIYLLQDARNNGALWHENYGLSGMQYGARQVFGDIKRSLESDPDIHFVLSPSWSNGTDIVARFFFNDPLPFELGSIRGYFTEYKEIDEDTVFIMMPEEYEDTLKSEKFTNINVEKVLPYPDEQPGFYYVTLRYVDNIDAIMAAERESRKQLQTGTLLINGKTLNIQYSLQDMGELKHLFDNDLNTVMRTMEANPLKVNAAYQQDQKTRSIALKIGGNASRVKIDLLDKDGRPIYSDERTYDETPDPRVIQFNFDEMLTFRSFNLEVESLHSPEPAHVHLWEIMILENQDE